jgi:hypothetical protein
MTGSHRGAVTFIERACLPGFYRAWCGLHQLDLVVQRAVSTLLGEEFYTSLTSLIGYLRRQMTFVAYMKAKCPRVVTTRWLSLGKASAWLVRNVIEVHAHINEREPACASSSAWWVTLYAVNRVMEDVTPVFVALQGLTTLVSEQESRLEALRNSLRETIGATRIIFSDNPYNDQLQVRPNGLPEFRLGEYSVTCSSVLDFLKDQGSLAARKYDSLDNESKERCVFARGSFVLRLMDGIQRISHAGAAGSDRHTPLPPVTPGELAKLRTHRFIVDVLEPQRPRLASIKTEADIHVIEVEHRELLRAIQCEDPLREALQKQGSATSFKDSWAVCQNRFIHLQEFCGGLATVFPGTAVVESDFSVVNYEKSANRQSLSDISLEGILHAKQFDLAQRLSQAPSH